MARRTKKVGIAGKYGCRYGSSLRRAVKKLETSSKTTAHCTHCGKTAVRRQAAGIWKCRSCNKTTAGAAYTLTSSAGVTVRSTIRRLREMNEA